MLNDTESMRFPYVRDQGVGGSNSLSPTIDSFISHEPLQRPLKSGLSFRATDSIANI